MYPVVQLVLKVAAEDYEGLDEFISSGAKNDLLEALREGGPSDDQKETLKRQMGQVQPVTRKVSGNDVNVYLRNSTGEILTFIVRKDGADWKIRQYSVRAK